MSDDDKEKYKLRDLSDRLGKLLEPYGLEPVKGKEEETDTNGWRTKVARWRNGKRPSIYMWLDKSVSDERELWWGFFSEKEDRLKDLRSLKQFKDIAKVGDSDWKKLKEHEQYLPIAKEDLNNANGIAFEHSSKGNGYALVIHQSRFDSLNDEDQCREAANFIGEIVFDLDPHLKEDQDIKIIKSEHKDNPTECETQIQARRGQGKFRRDLEIEWNSACAVSGCNVREVLRASHMMPWKDATPTERLDPNNGLLLSATYDALFDRGLITFDYDGRLLIAPILRRSSIRLPSLKGLGLLKSLSLEQKNYLKYHRDDATMRAGKDFEPA